MLKNPTCTSPSDPQENIQKSVSVIIPTYNERQTITKVITRCLEVLSPHEYDVELLVIDDDSPDLTWQYSTRLFGHDPRVRGIRRQSTEKGLAQSVAEGLREASHDYCAVIDADLQHPPERLPELFGALDQGADVAIGSRHTAGGEIENWSKARRLISRCGSRFAKAAVPSTREIKDPMSGFFACRRSVVQSVNLNPRGYKIILEILGKGQYERVVEVPYVFRDREDGESNLGVGECKSFLEHLGQLFVITRDLDNIVNPSRAVRAGEFAFIGAIGTIVNMVVFAAASIGVGAHFIVSGTVAFLAAVNWNFVGNWLLTYDRPRSDVLRMYAKFHQVSIMGYSVYVAVLTLLVLGGSNELLANGAAIIAGAGVNFFGSDLIVFPTGTSATETDESTDALPYLD